MIELLIGAAMVGLAPIASHRSGQWRERWMTAKGEGWTREEERALRGSCVWSGACFALLGLGLYLLLAAAWPCQ